MRKGRDGKSMEVEPGVATADYLQGFLRGTRTQEAAAAMLHLPFSTYRRYLARGTEIISDRLWDAELGAAANGITPPGGE